MSRVEVVGVVSRLHSRGTGFGVKETSTGKDGREFTEFWSVFPDKPADVSADDRVKVSGFLRAKTRPWTDRDGNERVGVDLTVSGASVEVLGKPEPEQWGTVGNETPF